MNDIKKGFTTAELLVTLAIIGTIAAITLPGFMKDYGRRIHVSRLQKSILDIETAVNEACVKKNVSKFYQTGIVSSPASIKSFFDTSASGSRFASLYKSLDGTKSESSVATDGTSFVLKEGMAINFTCDADANTCTFLLDTNGSDEPNIGGLDMFSLTLDAVTNTLSDSNASGTCVNSALGEGCYAELMQKGWKMKY